MTDGPSSDHPSSGLFLDAFDRRYDVFWSYFLSGLYSLDSLHLFLSFQSPQTLQTGQFKLYVLGWCLFVPLGFGLSWIVRRYGPNFYPALIPFNFFCFLIFTSCSIPSIAASLVWSLGNIGLVLFLKHQADRPTGWQLAIWPLMVLGALVWWWATFSTHFTGPLGVSLCVAVWVGLLTYRALHPLKNQRGKWEWLVHGAVLSVLAFVLVDPDLSLNYHHMSYFLGPLADLLGGKSLLVDINAQYGVLIFYFLSIPFHFIPLGFKSLCLILTVLFFIQYSLFYYFCRQIFRSVFLSASLLAVVLIINYFATIGHMTEYPSVGPLRFGFVYLFLSLLVLEEQRPVWSRWIYAGESLSAAIVTLWSFEVAVYTLPAYGILTLLTALKRTNTGWQFEKDRWLERVFLYPVFVFSLLILLYTDVFIRTHQLPYWDRYFDYIFLYQNGFFALPVPALGAWYLIVGVLFISFLTVIWTVFHRTAEERPPYWGVVVFLTFFGIFQFFYFLGRAHPNNLLHISMPSLMLTAYGAYQLLSRSNQKIPRVVQRTAGVLLGAVIVLYLPGFFPSTEMKVGKTWSERGELWGHLQDAAKDQPRDDAFAKRAGAIIERYSGPTRRVVRLFGDHDLELALYTGRLNALDYDDVVQWMICEPAVKRILTGPYPLWPGDHLYLCDDMEKAFFGLSNGEQARCEVEDLLWEQLQLRYELKKVEDDKDIHVFQVIREKTL